MFRAKRGGRHTFRYDAASRNTSHFLYFFPDMILATGSLLSTRSGNAHV
jgi:hypothetical protein